LTLAFGGRALLLACLGLCGVTTAEVSARTPEIGVRMASGASRAHVPRQVLGTAVVQGAAGLAIGPPVALVAGTLLQPRLFGVSRHDPVAIAAGTLVLVIAAAVAVLIPARRAATLDPIRALRTE
jgi:ABC-type antimicrobial peptide transport system permease subunit